MFPVNIEVMPPNTESAHVRFIDIRNDMPLDRWLSGDDSSHVRIVGYSETGTSTSWNVVPQGINTSRSTSSAVASVFKVMNDAERDSSAVGTEPAPAAAQVGETRTLSGLTFDQLAMLMGVQRRSIHNWMAGGNVKPSHRQRIGSVLAVLRHVDRGSTRENANLLLSPLSGGHTGLEMLQEGRFEEFKEVAGAGPGRSEAMRVDRSRTPMRGETPEGWLASVVRASSRESSDEATLQPARETRRVPFPKR